MARLIPSMLVVLAALALGACGQDKVELAQSSKNHGGAELFAQRCSGCHTLSTAGTRGSASNVRTAERNDGPNFNARCETRARVLYAISNGGFSGAIMPQNIVVGREARQVADFVARYAGQDVSNPPAPNQQTGFGRPQTRGATPSSQQPIGASGSGPKGCQESTSTSGAKPGGGASGG